MAIVDGIHGKLTWTQHTDEPAATKDINAVRINGWKLIERAVRKIDVTIMDQSFRSYLPDQIEWMVECSAWVNQSTSPGELHQLPATVRLQTDNNDANVYMEGECFIELRAFESNVDAPNRVTFRLFGTGALTNKWIP